MPDMHVGHVKSNEFALYVTKMLEEWDTSVMYAVNVAAKETAEEAAEMLHSAGDFKGKKYRKAWTVTSRQKSRGDVEQVVHNKKEYRLTHLLEFGHAKQNGGRTREFPHIAPVADKCPEIFERKLRDMIGEVSG